MAVPASQRQTSAMQYVETARRLARDTFAFANRLPKRYWRRLGDPLCHHATEALYEVQAANAIFVKTERDYVARRTHLQAARGHVDHVATLLDIAYDMQESPKEGTYRDFAQAIDKERALIQGVIKKDASARR